MSRAHVALVLLGYATALYAALTLIPVGGWTRPDAPCGDRATAAHVGATTSLVIVRSGPSRIPVCMWTR